MPISRILEWKKARLFLVYYKYMQLQKALNLLHYNQTSKKSFCLHSDWYTGDSKFILLAALGQESKEQVAGGWLHLLEHWEIQIKPPPHPTMKISKDSFSLTQGRKGRITCTSVIVGTWFLMKVKQASKLTQISGPVIFILSHLSIKSTLGPILIIIIKFHSVYIALAVHCVHYITGIFYNTAVK